MLSFASESDEGNFLGAASSGEEGSSISGEGSAEDFPEPFRVAFEIDDVLLPTSRYYKKWRNENKEGDFAKSKEASELYLQEPSKECLESLQRLRLRFPLVIVTSRNEELKEVTLEYIEKHFPKVFSEVIFSSPAAEKDKQAICLEKGYKVLVDNSMDFTIPEVDTIVLLPFSSKKHAYEGRTKQNPWNNLERLLK